MKYLFFSFVFFYLSWLYVYLFYTKILFFIFLLLPITTEAMGLGGLRANFLSLWRQRKCGRKDCQKHISRPKRIGVCYAVVVWCFISNLQKSSQIQVFCHSICGYLCNVKMNFIFILTFFVNCKQ